MGRRPDWTFYYFYSDDINVRSPRAGGGGETLSLKIVNRSPLFQDNADDKKDKSKDKKKVVIKTIELPIDAQTHGFSQQELNGYVEAEVSIVNRHNLPNLAQSRATLLA